MKENYNEFKNSITERMKKIPEVITREWLEDSLKNSPLFRIWGFCFADLSSKTFDKNVSEELLRKVSISTNTILSDNYPIKISENMFKIDESIDYLHNNGIDGEGINVAIIDQNFVYPHIEFKDSIVSYTKYSECEDAFHGSVVVSNFVGKNIGVAPNAKVYYFATNCSSEESIINEIIQALEDVYKMNEKGANIRVINISASLHTKSAKYQEIFEKLKNQGCYIIDSNIFHKSFACINKDILSCELYYSDWQNQVYESKKINIISGGMLEPLHDTDDGYQYCGQAANSWAIPRISGLFTLCLQVNPNLTYDEFVEYAEETKTVNVDGINLINPIDIIKNVEEEKLRKNI